MDTLVTLGLFIKLSLGTMLAIAILLVMGND
jgi:hypothetical protein